MIRLSLLQFRVQAITAAVTLAAFTILLAATGPYLASTYAADGLDSCHGGSCANLANYFTGSLLRSPYAVLWLLSLGIILLAPAVIGLFWGAPLIARELETGTAALAWNQSVTRTRWLAVKLTAGALAAMAVTEALCLMQAWWAAPISQAVADGASAGGLAQSRFSQLNFATHGVTPLGYAVFAFALGVTAGALIRRTVPAMAVTLAVFAALQVVMPLWVRPNLAPPGHVAIPVTSQGNFSAPDRPGRQQLHALRRQPPRPARCLAPVQRAGQRRRAASQHHPGRLRVDSEHRRREHRHEPGFARWLRCTRDGAGRLRCLPGPARHPGGHHLPARQPLLALPGHRDRDLRRPGAGPGRVLLPAAQPPVLNKPARRSAVRPSRTSAAYRAASIPQQDMPYIRQFCYGQARHKITRTREVRSKTHSCPLARRPTRMSEPRSSVRLSASVEAISRTR